MIIRNDAVSPTMMSEPVVRESARTSRNGGDISCGDEAVKSNTTATLTWTSWGVELHKGGRAPTMGGFLVKFLRKETWNVGISGMLSKEGLLRFSLS